MISDFGFRIADSGPRPAPRASTAVLLLLLLISFSGCGRPQVNAPTSVTPGASRPETGEGVAANPPSAIRHPPSGNPQLPIGFAPVRIVVLPLTELLTPSGTNQGTRLNTFVALLDAFGCQIKAPGVLRFELYEHIPRSAQLKGARLAIWPDLDLTGPVENNKYWRDFLRAYEFELDIQASRDRTYVLEATWCPDGIRLGGEYVLKGSLP